MKAIKISLLCMLALLCSISQPVQAEEKGKMEIALAMVRESLDTEALYTAFNYMTLMAIEARINSDPKTEGYREELINAYKEALKEAFYDPEILNSMYRMHAEIYAEEFNKEELEGLLSFYKTPLGKKYMKKQQIIMQKGEKKAESMISSVFATIFEEKLKTKIDKLHEDGKLPEDW